MSSEQVGEAGLNDTTQMVQAGLLHTEPANAQTLWWNEVLKAQV